MDFTYLNRGERIAGVAGALLILIMFIFNWFAVKGLEQLGGLDAWESYSFTDIVLFITALAAMALALMAASDTDVGLPVALSAIVTALGIISVILVLISIINPPSYDVPFTDQSVDTTTQVGVFLGLVAALAVTAGGYLSMQEEGTSFAAEADRFRGGGTGTGGPSAGPPSPPPPSSPPPPPSQPPPPTGGP